MKIETIEIKPAKESLIVETAIGTNYTFQGNKTPGHMFKLMNGNF